jgi:aconitate hydratase
MMRGTLAIISVRNQLGCGRAPIADGGLTVWDGQQTTIFEGAMRAAEDGVPLCVIAGEEYGSGSSRDWAAKGPNLLGIRFVLAQSYERIHRSNLVGTGVLPLQFPDGESAASLGLDGSETFDLAPLQEGAQTLRVTTSSGVAFDARVRIDTPNEWSYFRHGGILHYVLRQLRARA